MRVAAIIAIAMGLSNCASLIAKKNTYASEGPSVKINGATVRMQVNPQGSANGSMAFSAMIVSSAVATLEGPFRWRLEAVGTPGVHQSVVIHRLHTTTEKSKRSGWYPAEKLNRRADFKTSKDQPSIARARYEIPGLLKVDSATDGKLAILADVSVFTKDRRERKLVRFHLDPQQKRADEFIILPVEIVKTFGKDWEDIEDPSWD
jgi:hypothetical protein